MVTLKLRMVTQFFIVPFLDLCNIRLDFDTFVLTQPSSLVGSCNQDTAVATSPTGASPPANICGTLTGQHSK